MTLKLPAAFINDPPVQKNFETIQLNWVTGPVEASRAIGGAGQPAFTNSWVNFGSTYYTAGFFKDALGYVHLRGLIKNGTVGISAFTLPVGYRPTGTMFFNVLSNGAAGAVEVAINGDVSPKTPSNNTYVSLDGITFRVDG